MRARSKAHKKLKIEHVTVQGSISFSKAARGDTAGEPSKGGTVSSCHLP